MSRISRDVTNGENTMSRRNLALAASVAGLVLAGLAVPAHAVACSDNDDWANRCGVYALPYANTETTTSATLQTGEVAPTCSTSYGRSVWYLVFFNSVGSLPRTVWVDTNGSDYDTVLVVFVDAHNTPAASIACDDDSGNGLQSALSYTALPGTPYFVRVSGYNGASGSLTIWIG
jgi:hypothetical protein